MKVQGFGFDWFVLSGAQASVCIERKSGFEVKVLSPDVWVWGPRPSEIGIT